jgi:ribose/xylose/arabinose/galactoside ABC-type transport system permease subunit
MNMMQQAKPNQFKDFMGKIFKVRELGILIPFLVICAITAIINPVFLYAANLIEIARSISFTVIMGVGMTFALVGGGIDLSIGSTLALTGIISGLILKSGLPIPVAILGGILVGVVVGALNGFIIVTYKIPPMIATLGMMYVVRGVVYVITKGQPIYPFPAAFNQIGQGYLFHLPYSVYIAIVVLFVSDFIFKRTTFGRSVMAVGGNPETARISGINVKRTTIIMYIICSVCATITGVLMTARLSSAQVNAGTDSALTVIAAVIIGGTSLFGGSGSVWGTLIGTGIMTVLSYAMVITRISVYWQLIVVGITIILAVTIDTYRRRRMAGSRD